MIGSDAETGHALTGIAHLKQSTFRLITTPIGSRVMNRNYGCYATDFLDQPGNESNTLKLYAAIVNAILKFEPRFIPTRVKLEADISNPGTFDIYIEGIPTVDVGDIGAGSVINFTVPLAS